MVHKEIIGVNKTDSFLNNMALRGELQIKGKKVIQSVGKKNAWDEAEGFKSSKKCYGM